MYYLVPILGSSQNALGVEFDKQQGRLLYTACDPGSGQEINSVPDTS